MRFRPALLALLPVAFLLASCNADTDPVATNVTTTSATVHGTATWTQNDANGGWEWRWVWSSDGGANWEGSPWLAVPNCASSPCSAHVQRDLTGLTPDTTYTFALQSRAPNGASFFGDSNGYNGQDDPPYEFDTFTTEPLPPVDSYPSITQIDRDGDFDPCGQITGSGAGCWGSVVSANTGTIATETSVVGEGATAGRFTWPSGNDQRAELNWHNASGLNPEVEYEFLAHFPASVDFAGYVAQNKFSGAGSGCANGGVRFGNNFNPPQLELVTRASCSASTVIYPLGVPPKDQWFAVRVHEKFADFGGFAQVWVDPDGPGPLAYEERLPLTQNLDTSSDSASGIRFRLGPYDGDQDGGTIRFDGYRMDILP